MADSEDLWTTAREMRYRSGQVTITDDLVSFLYTLIRDHVPPGIIEEILLDMTPGKGKATEYCNGWLASYAKDIADRLRGEATSQKASPTSDDQS
jgi:hypothetical protein